MQSIFTQANPTKPLTIEGEPVKVLIVDDERAIREFCKVILDPFEIVAGDASGFEEAKEALAREAYDIVLTDIEMPGEDGLELLKHCRQRDPHQVVIIISGFGTIERAVDAMKCGAFDFIQKPLSPDVVRAAVRKAASQRELALENLRLRSLLKERYSFANLVGKSRSMQEIYHLIQRVGPTDTPVLIQGESGTGKRAVANAIYVQSNRHGKGLVKACCSTLPVAFQESEFFGFAQGAVPGATAAKKGLFRQAHLGTLILEDIDAAPLDVQMKISRAIQEREIRPIGQAETQSVDVRLIATSRRDLRDLVRSGRFREELYYLLSVVQINIPPLRDRLDDLPLLVRHFANRFTERGLGVPRFSPEATRCLMNYSWPGNIRELANCVDRAGTLCAGGEILPCDLPAEVVDCEIATKPEEASAEEDCSRNALVSLEEGERRQIDYVFKALGGHRGKTASVLQISRRSLYDKLKRYGITE